MRLTELDPTFIRYEVRTEDGAPRVYFPYVKTLAEAQGVEFLCPRCFAANDGRIGTHAVICWSRSRGAPDDARPGPGRWRMVGTGLGDLTLDADPPSTARSVELKSGCKWHGYVTDGEVT